VKGCYFVYDRNCSEPELSLWKKNFVNTDGVVETHLESSAGGVIGQSVDTECTTGSLSLSVTHADTRDIDNSMIVSEGQSVGQKMNTEEMGVSAPSCSTTESLPTDDVNISHTESMDVESSLVSENQQPGLEQRPCDEITELPVSSGRPDTAVHQSAESTSSEPMEAEGDQNQANPLPGRSLPEDVMSLSLSVDSEAANNLSAKPATDNTEPLSADDCHSAEARQVLELLSFENIQPSASELQPVRTNGC